MQWQQIDILWLVNNLSIYYKPVFHEPVVFAVFNAVAYDKHAMVEEGTTAIRFIIHSYKHGTHVLKSFFCYGICNKKHVKRYSMQSPSQTTSP